MIAASTFLIAAQAFAPLPNPSEIFSVPQGVFAATLDGFPEGREGRQELRLNVTERDDGSNVVLLTVSGLLDDSVAAEQQRAVMRPEDDGWRVVELGRRWRCHRGRGPSGWTTRLCN